MEQHLEGLASPPEDDPVPLDLFQAGVAHQVANRERDDAAPLDVLEVRAPARPSGSSTMP